jgi:hypothetical protein
MNNLCVNAQLLGGLTVLLPLVGVIVGLLLARSWRG